MTAFLQAPMKCAQLVRERVRRGGVKDADHRDSGLLRPRRERPRSGCAAEKRDELSPSHGLPSQAQDHTLKSNRVGRSATSIHVRNPQYRRSMQWICSCGVMPGSEPPEAIESARNKQGARLSTSARHLSASPPAATTLAPCG